MHAFFRVSVSGFLGCISRRGITASKGSFVFSFLRNLHTASHRGCSSLRSHQQCTRAPFSTSSPALVCGLIGDGHSDRCEAGARCGFHLRGCGVLKPGQCGFVDRQRGLDSVSLARALSGHRGTSGGLPGYSSLDDRSVPHSVVTTQSGQVSPGGQNHPN